MKTTIALAALALGVATAAAAQNRPAAAPAATSQSANSSSKSQTVQAALAGGVTGTNLAAQVRNDGLNICGKKPDKKKCSPASP